ncbi:MULTISPECIES: hypothetical protein [unclassified Streptomyces]|uniref:hypothetical protein n=1 Tax=Streptomyces sp. NPDC056227 TaxID=3345753 RepID=UPI002B1CABDD|nr:MULTISPECIES: hypothetical protein [unclassified Streptomyces]
MVQPSAVLSPHLQGAELSDCDYIVVGAGSAGCVPAARLSEDPTVRVALVESGGRDPKPEIRIPAGCGCTA